MEECYDFLRIETDRHIIAPHMGTIYNKRSERFCDYVQIDKTRENHNYMRFRLNGKNVRNHRYIYEMYHGIKIPKGMQINHINEDKLDNRISNLEMVTNQQNKQATTMYRRNTSGFKGVCWHKRDKVWRSQICFNEKIIHLGNHQTKELAARSYNFYAEFLNNTKECKYILN